MHPGPRVRVTSGTPGLDEVLSGGFLRGQTTILSGGPGTGKTIFALQFLAAGGDGLYVGFEEREHELRRNADALGIDLSNVSMLDLSASGDRFFDDDAYTVFPSEEVEGSDLVAEIASTLQSTDVDRLVIDPLSELRSLLPDDFQFKRNISSLFVALAERDVTTLCTAQPPARPAESDLEYLGNTAIELRRVTDRRTLEVTKFRGSSFQAGRHVFRITADEGVRVYPTLVPGDHYRERDRTPLSSDVEALDALLGGGIERGSVTVISGPSGVGKTTTGSQFLQAAARRDERALVYLFEELRSDYLHRATALGMDVQRLADDGRLEVEEVEALARSPDEFATHVREAVEDRGVEFVMIDGIAGYRLGLRGQDSSEALTRQLHALCRYLKRMGVTVVLVEEVTSVTGEFSPTETRISYLADNLVFLRYLDTGGRLDKAIGVLKKRYGGFQNTLHELSIEAGDGLQVGESLAGERGLLAGVTAGSDDDDALD